MLFGNPDRVAPKLSPDGRRLAYLRPVDGVMNVWVGTLGGDDFQPVTDDRGRGIHEFTWAGDNRHVLFVQDRDGDENWHVNSVVPESGAVRDHTPIDGVQALIVGVSPRRPNEVVFAINADDPTMFDLYRLDLANNALVKELSNPGFDEWLIDLDLRVRGAERTRDDGGLDYLIGDGDPALWEPVLEVTLEDAPMGTPAFAGFDPADGSMYMLTPIGSDTIRLARVNTDTGEVVSVWSDSEFDVSSVVLHPDTGRPQLATVGRERADTVVLDDAIAEEISVIRAGDAGDFRFVDRDREDTVWLVAFSHDDGPDSYYCWHRDRRELRFLFDHQPALRDYALAKCEPFSFRARDGLTIRGYATFPVGVERSRLPTVLNVHGGPWGTRHEWGYSPTAQWLANRGYLCLEVNFRGSSGYGKHFAAAGMREWGAKMQDDLLDGCQWAIDAGYADPDRIAIMGGSYGGYAALVGATFTPHFFRCAIDIVGPSNLVTFLETVPPYWSSVLPVFHKMVGHPERDREFLWSRSPLSRVDDISIPILVAQGANDPRVKQSESEQIVAAMQRRGVPHEYLLFADEGHGFARAENRLAFYRAAETFLATHLAVRPPS